MKFRISLLITTVLLCQNASGQNFNGQVLDSLSQKPIPFANIYLIEHQTGTISDTNGNFELSLNISGRIHLQISCMGYQTLIHTIDPASVAKKTFYLRKSHLQLHEVVVSTSSIRLQQDNIVSVTQRSISELNLKAPSNLTEALSDIPGIDNFSSGPGIGKPVIRGLSGNRIVVYSQNVRVENQQWGDEHGLGVGDVGIENVEIIKGASSLLYGSDALGGVIYFVDETYAPINSVKGFISSNFNSNNIGTNSMAGVKLNTNNFRINMFGSFGSFADYQLPNSKRVNNTRFSEANFKTSMGFHHKKWVGNLRYSYLSNQFGITEDEEPSTSTSRTPEIPFQNVDDHLLSFENKLFLNDIKLSATVGYNSNSRKEFEESETDPSLSMLLETISYNVKGDIPMNNETIHLIAGAQGMFQQNTNRAEELLIPDAQTTDIGTYLVLNYMILNDLTIEGGIRFDNRNITSSSMQTDEVTFEALENDYNSFNFAIGSSFKKEKFIIRGNVASGFRAPTTTELLSNGVHEGALRYEIGDVNLKSEQATQFDLNVEYESEHFGLYVNPFFNQIDNFILLSPTDSIIEGVQVYFYEQTTAHLMGGEVGFHWHPHPVDWLHIESNFSTVMAEDDSGNKLPLIPANKIQSVLKGEIHNKGKVKLENIFIEHIYKFKQDRTAEFESNSPDYHLVNAGILLLIEAQKTNIEVTTGVKNIFNTAYIDHLSRFKNSEINNPGINAYLGLKLSF